MQVVAAVILGEDLLVIGGIPNGGLKVNDAVGQGLGADPLVDGQAGLFAHAIVIHATGAGQNGGDVDLNAVAVCHLDVLLIALLDHLGRIGQLAHGAELVGYAGMDQVIDAVEQEYAIDALLHDLALKAFDAGRTPVLLEAVDVVTQDAVAADALTYNGAVGDTERAQTASQTIGPRLCGDGVTEGNDGFDVTVGIGCEIDGVQEAVRAVFTPALQRNVSRVGMIAAGIILLDVVAVVGVTGHILGQIGEIQADGKFLACLKGEGDVIGDIVLTAGFHGQALLAAEGDVGDGGRIDRAALGELCHGGTGDGGGLGVEAVGEMQTECAAVHGGIDAVAEGLILEIFGVVHADDGASGTPTCDPFDVSHDIVPLFEFFDVISVSQFRHFFKCFDGILRGWGEISGGNGQDQSTLAVILSGENITV